jgi:hypothetical protein
LFSQSVLSRSAYFIAAVAAVLIFVAQPARAQGGEPQDDAPAPFTLQTIVEAGHDLFGTLANNLAALIERAFQRYGVPDAYVIGQEAGGAILFGVRYGNGLLHMADGTETTVYWRGPSLGLEVGASGSRVLMLVYDLDAPNDILRRFSGVEGSAYAIGGLGMTVLSGGDTLVVPVRAGFGARLGFSVGYLAFSAEPTWTPL